jgi:Protein of unknown function (DUF4058)
MPLFDHFRPPVLLKRHWSEFHGQWPAEIVRTLFDRLPPGYYAGPRLYLGSSFEVDISVARDDDRSMEAPEVDSGGVATLPVTETFVANLLRVDDYEVRIFDTERARTLVAAIEIVSPSNKDRPESRSQFVSKCSALLQEGVCVSIVDIVTERLANLYLELRDRMKTADSGESIAVPRIGAEPSSLYAVTLRVRHQIQKPPLLDTWYYPLEIGQPLPTIPLWLSHSRCIELPLEAGYAETCRILRIT